jgi:hypothetical protein
MRCVGFAAPCDQRTVRNCRRFDDSRLGNHRSVDLDSSQDYVSRLLQDRRSASNRLTSDGIVDQAKPLVLRMLGCD